MANQQLRCPRCQGINAGGSRFCSHCGVAFSIPQVIKKQSLPAWAIALIATVGLCGICGIIGNLADKNKQSNSPQQIAATNQPPANIAATPTPKPTFAELKANAETLLKFKKDEYEQKDLEQFDKVINPLREIPKDAKEFKEAQALIKKLIDKSAPIAAEIVVLGPKPKNSEWDGRVQPVVEYLQANLNDYEDSEWLEWSPVTKITVGKEPYWAVRLKLRAKNAFGAKILKDVVFFIRNEKVVQTSGL